MLVVWFVGTAVDMANLSPSWDLPPAVHVTFSTIVGAIYVGSAVSKSRGGSE